MGTSGVAAMLEFPTWKKVWLWGLTLLAVYAALPSLLSATSVRWPDMLPNPTVNLGLDLAGGSHILLEADPSQVAAQRLENMEETVRSALRSAEPRIRAGRFFHPRRPVELPGRQPGRR